MCRKVLLKALQGSTGPFLWEPFSTKQLLQTHFMPLWHGQNQRCDNITQSQHNNLGTILPTTMSSTEILEAGLSSKPSSGWHSDPLCCMGQGQNSPYPLWMNLVKLILSYLQCEIHRQHTASQLSRQSPFNQKSTKQIISKFLVTS